MTMFVPTGSTIAVDTEDCILVAPRQSGVNAYATLYLAQGSPVPVDAAPGDLVDEINDAAGLTSGSLFVGPTVVLTWPTPIYFAGAHAKRVQATQNGLGSTVTFAGISSTVTAPAVTRDAMVTLINDCATPGGGSPPGAGQKEFEWDSLDNVAQPATSFMTWTFVQEPGEADGVGIVTLAVSWLNGAPASAAFCQMITAANELPYPPDRSLVYGVLSSVENEDLDAASSAYIDSGLVYVSWTADNTSNSSATALFQYATGAS